MFVVVSACGSTVLTDPTGSIEGPLAGVLGVALLLADSVLPVASSVVMARDRPDAPAAGRRRHRRDPRRGVEHDAATRRVGGHDGGFACDSDHPSPGDVR
jgi:hypothetical protein